MISFMIQSPPDPPQTLSELRIGAHSVLEFASSIVASSSDAGFDPYNLIDSRPSSYWRPSAFDTIHYVTFTLPHAHYVNFFAFYSTDLAAKRGSMKLQYSTDGTLWVDACQPCGPAETAPMYVTFTKVFAAWFRLVVYCPSGSLPTIGVVYAGEEFRPERGMCVGFTPPTLGAKPVVLTNNSMAGAWLGRALRSRLPYEGTLQFDLIPPERARKFYKPLIDRLARRPFFLKWHGAAAPYEIAYCWTEDANLTLSYSKPNFMAGSVKYTGLVG